MSIHRFIAFSLNRTNLNTDEKSIKKAMEFYPSSGWCRNNSVCQKQLEIKERYFNNVQFKHALLGDPESGPNVRQSVWSECDTHSKE